MKLSGKAKDRDFYRQLDCDYSEFSRAVKLLLVFNKHKYPVEFELPNRKRVKFGPALIDVRKTQKAGRDDMGSLFVNFAMNDHIKVFLISIRYTPKITKEYAELVLSVMNGD